MRPTKFFMAIPIFCPLAIAWQLYVMQKQGWDAAHDVFVVNSVLFALWIGFSIDQRLGAKTVLNRTAKIAIAICAVLPALIIFLSNLRFLSLTLGKVEAVQIFGIPNIFLLSMPLIFWLISRTSRLPALMLFVGLHFYAYMGGIGSL